MWNCRYCNSNNSDNDILCAACGQARYPGASEATDAGSTGQVEKRKPSRRTLLIAAAAAVAVVVLVICLLAAGPAGYYRSESGEYSFSLEKDGSCFWYQNGIRFTGSYEKTENGLMLSMTGGGVYKDTSFTAVRQGRNAYRVEGGTVDGELFTKQKKPADIAELDKDQSAADSEQGPADSVESAVPSQPSGGKISIQPTTMLDAEGIKVVATEYSGSNLTGFLTLEVSNTSTKERWVESDQVLLNGEPVSAFFMCSLDPGETQDSLMLLNEELLYFLGDDRIESISMSFSVMDNGLNVLYESQSATLDVQDGRSLDFDCSPLELPLIDEDRLKLNVVGYRLGSNPGEVHLFYELDNRSDIGVYISGNTCTADGEEFSFGLSSQVGSQSKMLIHAAAYLSAGAAAPSSFSFQLELTTYDGEQLTKSGNVTLEFDSSGEAIAAAVDLPIYKESQAWKEYFAAGSTAAAPSGSTAKPQSTAPSADGGNEKYRYITSAYIDSAPCYIVSVADFGEDTGFKRFFGQTDTADFYDSGSSFCYFQLQQPIENALLFCMDLTITSGGDDLSGIEWAFVVHDAEADKWYICEDYDYVDSESSIGLYYSTKPMTIDAVTVLPVDAPNGCGGFMLSFDFGDATIGFGDYDSACTFIDSLG